MSDRDSSEDILQNQETLKRRAWVDRAVQSARRRVDKPEAAGAVSDGRARKPRLVVVSGSGKR